MAVIGALQATGKVGQAQDNLDRLSRYAQEAAAAGVEILVTPELFATGYAPALVSERDGQRIREQLSEIAARAAITLVASTVEHREGRRHISASMFGSTGDELTRYRKAYLYGQEEQAHFEPGDGAIDVISVAGLQVALSICYDIEFPETARAAAKRGADVLLVPTAVPYTGDLRGERGHVYNAGSISTLMVPCRSLENGIYIAYANHAGPDFTGQSCITSPYGNILALGSSASDELLVTEAFASEVRRARTVNTYLDDLRD